MSAVAERPTSTAVQPYRFTAEQYRDMVENGYFDGKRVEFIGGEVVAMSSQSNDHYGSMEDVYDLLKAVFGPNYWVRMQATLDLSPLAVPDPDIAVVPGPRRRGKVNPTSAVLIVEISDSRLQYDRVIKSSLYAAASIPEFWIVNIPDRQLEIRRDPRPDAAAEFGFSYGSLATLKPGDTATPLALPSGVVAVDQLFF